MNFSRKYIIGIALAILLTTIFQQPVYSWGFYAHKKINRMAVFTLPPEMILFYKKHIEYITEYAVNADKRRYAIEGEAALHYIDLDHYVSYGQDPLSVIPKKWNDAVVKFTEDTLRQYGIVPWHVNLMVKRLTKAFEQKDIDKILRISADLGHYIADSHVPLHTTKNYNGQYTNQKGIHGLWESRLPELKSSTYDLFVGRAAYIDNILDDEWITIRESFVATDAVLSIEKNLDKQFPKDQKYVYENKGVAIVKTYSEAYATQYHTRLQGMVERRLTRAVLEVGSYWYTAWVNAGQPNLKKLAENTSSIDWRKENNIESNPNKIKVREHQH